MMRPAVRLRMVWGLRRRREQLSRVEKEGREKKRVKRD